MFDLIHFVGFYRDTILVNRGWVPPELIKPATRTEAQVNGPVTVLGNLVPGDSPKGPSVDGRPIITLKNQVDKNIWFWKDLNAMAELTGAKPILLDVQADPPNPGGYPIGGVTQFPLENPFRQHAAIAYVAAALKLGAAFQCRFSLFVI
jgi:surfeit locus 1 family protein